MEWNGMGAEKRREERGSEKKKCNLQHRYRYIEYITVSKSEEIIYL
jgi:hypothetical protein